MMQFFVMGKLTAVKGLILKTFFVEKKVVNTHGNDTVFVALALDIVFYNDNLLKKLGFTIGKYKDL